MRVMHVLAINIISFNAIKFVYRTQNLKLAF